MTALISISTMIFGLWLCDRGIISYLDMKKKEAYGTHTKAIIVEILREESEDSEGHLSVTYWPIFEYMDIYSNIHQKRPSSTTDMEKYTVGDIVDIAYLPDDNEAELLVNNSIGKWKNTIGFLVSGMFTFFIGLGVFIHNDCHISIFKYFKV